MEKEEVGFRIVQVENGYPICIGGLIHQQISKVTAECKPVGKDGDNKQQGYKFRKVDDVVNEVSPLLGKHELTAIPIKTKVIRDEFLANNNGKNRHCVGLIVTYKISAKDGSFQYGEMPGYSEDFSDKAFNQAVSFSYKYFLIELFCIAVEGIDGDAKSPHLDPAGKFTQEEVNTQISIAMPKYVDVAKRNLLASIGKELKTLLVEEPDENGKMQPTQTSVNMEDIIALMGRIREKENLPLANKPVAEIIAPTA